MSNIEGAFAWFTSDRAAVVISIFALLVALVGWITTRRGVSAAEDQARHAASSARTSEEGVEVARRSAETAEVAARASQDQVSAAWQSVRQAEEAATIARRQLELDQQVFNDQNQPYVYADIRPDDDQAQLIVVVIENLGRSVATEVIADFEPALQSTQIAAFANVSQLRIGTLAPNRRYKYFFDVSFQYLASDKPLSYRVSVKANGPNGPVSLLYDINLEDLRQTAAAHKANLGDVVKAINDVRTSLQRISMAISVQNLHREQKVPRQHVPGESDDHATEFADDGDEALRRLGALSVPLKPADHVVEPDIEVTESPNGTDSQDDNTSPTRASTES